MSYSPVEGACDGVPGGAVMVERATTFTHTLSNLQAYTEYSITVRARGADGLGSPSTARTGRTAADGKLEECTDKIQGCMHVPLLCTTVPGPPQMVSVINGSSSSGIAVSWREPNCSDINDNGVTGYQIRYGVLSETRRSTTPTITSGTMFTISASGLQLFTDYSIQVAAINSEGVGTFSQPKIGVITGGENLDFKVSLDS